MTPGEFAAKSDYEGGITSSLEYGLRADDLDDSDPDLKRAWFRLQLLWSQEVEPLLQVIQPMLDHHLDEYVEED